MGWSHPSFAGVWLRAKSDGESFLDGYIFTDLEQPYFLKSDVRSCCTSMKLGARPHYLPMSIFAVKTELDPFYTYF
jgi:hypothetical protein